MFQFFLVWRDPACVCVLTTFIVDRHRIRGGKKTCFFLHLVADFMRWGLGVSERSLASLALLVVFWKVLTGAMIGVSAWDPCD